MAKNKLKLNDPFIRNHPTPEKRIEIYDAHTKGLAVRITKKGSKSFVFRYRFNDKVRRFTIGRYPNISLAKAREEAGELAYKVSKGIDPLEEKSKRKHTPKEAIFKEVATEFMDKYLPTLRDRTAKEYKRHIEVYLASLNNVPIDEISKNQILSILDQKAHKDGSPTQANRIRSTLSSLFSFAEKRGTVKANLIKSIPTYKTGKSKRSRYYTENEIRELWDFFDYFTQPTREVFKMLLITGQRKTETMNMRWSDLDLDKQVWTIPAELAKNKQPHDIPLSNMAMEILEDLKGYSGDFDYVFNSPRKENKAIGYIKNSKEKIQDNSNIPDFRPHDLRRTVATYMAKLGVDRTVLGKILNHKGLSGDSQVTAIYDRHSYLKEKRQALNRWSHKLGQIIEDKETKIVGKIG